MKRQFIYFSILLVAVCNIEGTPKHVKPDFYHDLEDLDQEQKYDKIDDPLPGGNASCDDFFTVRHQWSKGKSGKMNFDVPQDISGWKITVKLFSLLNSLTIVLKVLVGSY